MPYKDKTKRLAASADWNRRNPDRIMRAVHRYQQRVIAAVLEAYGGKCEECGTDSGLCLHHRKHDGPKHREEIGDCFRIYLWAIRNGFPKDRLMLLCRSCHAKLHWRERKQKERQWTQVT